MALHIETLSNVEIITIGYIYIYIYIEREMSRWTCKLEVQWPAFTQLLSYSTAFLSKRIYESKK